MGSGAGRKAYVRVVYLVAVRPGQKCGVADYTRQLAQAVTQQGIDARVEELPAWSIPALRGLTETYGGQEATIFHLQYPSLGMGKSCAPALLPMVFPRRRVFITLHEFEKFNPVRKLYFLFSGLFTGNFIFTNEHERQIFSRFLPWRENSCHIIPIGNNIAVFPVRNEIGRVHRRRLIYFGQIAPDKGIEEFLQTVEHLRRQNDDIPCSIIGALLDPNSEIARKIRDVSNACRIDCLFNLSSEDVSKELQKASIALLPFPEGVSDKRGSALVCLKHGLAVITRHSDLTPQWWRETTHGVENSQYAARMIGDILAGRREKVPLPSMLAHALSEREWSNIAKSHIALYEKARPLTATLSLS
jgi:glycosyltransferase involved in cell wall biosynthesis